jgi:hypothetical protein
MRMSRMLLAFTTIPRKSGLILMALPLCILAALTIGPVSAQASFSVDAWTSKGGQGYGTPGGNFLPGEEVVVNIAATHDCYAAITVGPYGEEASQYFDAELRGGDTVALRPPSGLTGTWVVTVDAVSLVGSALSSDYVVFSIGSAEPAPSPTPPVTATIGPEDAMVLDALIVLKMVDESLPPDLEFDVDGDGQITVDDARLILRWAVQ